MMDDSNTVKKIASSDLACALDECHIQIKLARENADRHKKNVEQLEREIAKATCTARLMGLAELEKFANRILKSLKNAR